MDFLPGLLGSSTNGNGNSTNPGSGTPLPPAVDKGSCSLLGGVALLVQGLMAVLVLLTLVIKRARESPPRPWTTWIADVSKQIIGQGFLHSTNILISTLFQHHQARDACVAYFLSIFVDCTLGVLFIYATLRLFSYILTTRLRLRGFKNGEYYPTASGINQNQEDSLEDALHPQSSPQPTSSSSSSSGFQITWWARQLLVYILTLCVMKAAIIGFFWIPWVFPAGDWLLSWLGEDTKVVFVLMIFPLFMNAIQFLLIDTILKSSHHPDTSSSSSEPKSSSRRGRNGSSNSNRDDENDDEEAQAFLSRGEASLDDEEARPASSGENRGRGRSDAPIHPPSTPPRRGSNQSNYNTRAQAQAMPLSSTPPRSPSYPPSYRSSSSSYPNPFSSSSSYAIDDSLRRNEKTESHASIPPLQKIEIRLTEPTPQKKGVGLGIQRKASGGGGGGGGGGTKRTLVTAHAPMSRTSSNTSNGSTSRNNLHDENAIMEADEKESRSDGGWDWLDEDEEQEQKPDRIPKRIEAEAGNDYDDVDEDDDFDAWGHNDSNSDRGSMDRARSRDGFISRQTIGVA